MPDFLIDVLAGLSVPEALCLATGLFSSSLVPFFLLVGVDYRAAAEAVSVWLLAVVSDVCRSSRDAAVSAAALLMLLSLAPEATR